MIRKILLAAVSTVALGGSTALAADASAPSFDWTGFYLGATAGGHSHTATVSNGNTSDYEYFYPGDSMDATGYGAIGGLELGYNADLGNALVLGVEGDFSAATGTGSSSAYDGDAIVKSKLDYLGTVRGRIGIAVDRALIYGTGGLAWGDINTTVCDSSCGSYGYSNTKWRMGWVAGGGVEYAIDNNWTAKAEGLYYDLGTDGQADTVGGYTNYREANKGLIARIGLNYKF